MTEHVIDDFSNAALFSLIASGQAQVDIASEPTGDGHALRVAYDFRGGGGFIGVRQDLSIRLPPICTLQFRLRGTVGGNNFEFKLTDRSRRNVWRWYEKNCEIPEAGRQFSIRNRDIEFAWGPKGGGRPGRLGGIEFVIAAGPGGQGVFWLEGFQMVNRTPRQPPEVTASSSARKAVAASLLTKEGGSWKPGTDDSHPTLTVNFHQPREFGGLVIDWADQPSTARAFSVDASDDGRHWGAMHRAHHALGERSFIPLPSGESQFLRLKFQSPAAVRKLEIQPYEFSKTQDEFLYAVAAASPKGHYPRYLLRQQSYWTSAGLPDGQTCALINEEGLVEPDKGTFSLEPFLFLKKKLVTWADVQTSVHLDPTGLPIPTTRWKLPDVTLDVTPFASRPEEVPQGVCLVRYRLANRTRRKLKGSLFIAARPHQTTPPWQGWNGLGGVARIADFKWSGGGLLVNQHKLVVPLAEDVECGVCPFEEGGVIRSLATGQVPEHKRVSDASGLASAALKFEFTLPAGGEREIFVAVPFGAGDDAPALTKSLKKLDGAEEFATAEQNWRQRLGSVTFDVPAGTARKGARTFRTAAGQILIHRDGPAIQPGSRRYTRSWVRDGVLMAAALLRAGESAAPVEFIKWFTGFQREDGFVPCCVDRSGQDWLVEHDSHGQLIYGILEAYRFTKDADLLHELWPAVVRAADFIHSLRRQRLTREYSADDKLACRGLLPESVSHEGYLAQPVHAYWDDFWGLRGLRDAAAAAEILGYAEHARRYREEAEDFQTCVRDSLQRVISTRKLHFVPGSVEWADFDATATANAVMLLDTGDPLPVEQLRAMFRQFVEDVGKRRRGEFPWNNYTAYEVRILGALVRLGMRSEALVLLEFYLGDRRPRRWHQWPEISWHNPRSPGHLGDLPHTWIAGEFMLAFASMFVYEKEPAGALVIGAGVGLEWLAAPRGVRVRGLPTRHGIMDVQMVREKRRRFRVKLSGELASPPGGIVLELPWPAPPRRVTCNGVELEEFDAQRILLSASLPMDVIIEC